MTYNDFFGRMFAALGAVAMTTTLFVSSFTPSASTVSGMLV